MGCAASTKQADEELVKWLQACHLDSYANDIENEGYTNMYFIKNASREDLDELVNKLGMKTPHAKALIGAWQKLGEDTAPQQQSGEIAQKSENVLEQHIGEVTQQAVRWNSCGPEILLSEDGMTVVKTSQEDADQLLVTAGAEMVAGRHYWEVQLLEPCLSHSLIGVVPATNQVGRYYFINTMDGSVKNTEQVPYDQKGAGRFDVNDRVGILLDLDKGWICFSKNGVVQGPGFTSGVTGPLMRAAQLHFYDTPLLLLPDAVLPSLPKIDVTNGILDKNRDASWNSSEPGSYTIVAVKGDQPLKQGHPGRMQCPARAVFEGIKKLDNDNGWALDGQAIFELDEDDEIEVLEVRRGCLTRHCVDHNGGSSSEVKDYIDIGRFEGSCYSTVAGWIKLAERTEKLESNEPITFVRYAITLKDWHDGAEVGLWEPV
eukprot:TRINITY_DN42708_c0_g1_i1.p1 TRINITY_DN42708_c0_g1~~TRINITY_DN42708_c0_g1_i1.p1  ORF type:complete len:431 (-),score=61.97 TRINITY_DN42708_c0_g1_i1:81-1373(-)